MIRRISTKLLIAVLAAVVIPFLGFALFVDMEMAERLSRGVVLDSLKGLSSDLASQLDRDLEGIALDARLWTRNRSVEQAIAELALDAEPQVKVARVGQGEIFDDIVLSKPEFDLLLLLDARGRFVVSNTLEASGELLSDDVWNSLAGRDWSREEWFAPALAGDVVGIDWGPSRFLPPRDPSPGPRAENYEIGYALPVFPRPPIPADGGVEDEASNGPAIGVLLVLVNWKHVQDQIRQPVLKTYFQGLVGEDGRPSAYAWIWKSDADTIIAHEREELYGKSITGDLNLGKMTTAALSGRAGLYDEYTFQDKRKNAAFAHTAGPERFGFDWVVGVGIDNDDIYLHARELRSTLFKATALSVLVAVLWTMVIARRTTRPILELQEHTQRVSAGDLDARVPVRSNDELGELARGFNRMTAELKEQRERLVKAEKDAAWREMARQVAHDIKNPLTPIQLSLDLARRAKSDKKGDFDAIFERTADTISRQVAHLREIASDFHALTGAPNQKPQRFQAWKLMDEVLELHAAWARERGVAIEKRGSGGELHVDPSSMRRVLQNLVSNALEAMAEGGKLAVSIEPRDGRIAIALRDSGAGIPPEVRSRLFEPYFTTRSAGTGLGLAIAKRVVEEMGGTILLLPNDPEPGTTALIELPPAAA